MLSDAVSGCKQVCVDGESEVADLELGGDLVHQCYHAQCNQCNQAHVVIVSTELHTTQGKHSLTCGSWQNRRSVHMVSLTHILHLRAFCCCIDNNIRPSQVCMRPC